MLLSQAEFARRSGVTRQAVQFAIRKGDLHRRPNGKIDTSLPVNREYMERDRSDTKSSPVKPPKVEKVYPAYKKPPKVPKPPRAPLDLPEYQDVGSAELDPATLLDPANVATTTKDSLAKLKTIRQIRDLELNNEIKRNKLIDRKLVNTVLSRKYEIDMASYLTIKDKLMPDIMAIVGVNDPELVIKAGERMDEELWKVLKHTKVLFNKFLNEIKAEEIDDAERLLRPK